jgi:hypothetical protein
MKKRAWVTLQVAILVIPAFFASLLLHPSHYGRNGIENFGVYLLGVTGIFGGGYLRGIFGFGYGLIFAWGSILYISCASLLFYRLYKATGNRNRVVVWVNALLSGWSVLVGWSCMTLANQ